MTLIRHIHRYAARKPQAKQALVLCGFGGSIWQVRRLVRVLQNDGYTVTALDFPKSVLDSGNPALLPELVDEVMAFAEDEKSNTSEPIVLVGISLGALIALNVLRRSPHFTRGILITGGDIVKIARKLYGNAWPQSYQAHVQQWHGVNMYTEPQLLAGKQLLFVLPRKDHLIDSTDIHREVRVQQEAGNKLILIERHSFGHIGTIIEETIIFPRRIRAYMKRLT